jgi:hypothetical protein
VATAAIILANVAERRLEGSEVFYDGASTTGGRPVKAAMPAKHRRRQHPNARLNLYLFSSLKSRFAMICVSAWSRAASVERRYRAKSPVNDLLIAYLVRKSDAVKPQWPCLLFALLRATRRGLVYSRLLGHCDRPTRAASSLLLHAAVQGSWVLPNI